MTPEPIPTDLVRWTEMQFTLWEIASERYDETQDERWLIAAHGSRLLLQPLLDECCREK